MKSWFAVALAVLSVLMISASTAAFTQQLYPVQGQSAKQTPPPVYTAKLTGYLGGNISLVLANGESFKGKWAYVRVPFVNVQTPGTPTSYPPQPNLAFDWDSIYGEGYFLSNILGEQIGQSIVTGDQGTVLQLEFLNGKFGVAADNKGNIYKMVW
jgi:hypothetical protein